MSRTAITTTFYNLSLEPLPLFILRKDTTSKSIIIEGGSLYSIKEEVGFAVEWSREKDLRIDVSRDS